MLARFVLLMVAMSVLIAGKSMAGVCTMSPEYYVECLEGTRPWEGECQSPYICLECAGAPMNPYKRWGTAAARKQLFAMRDVSYRDRLITVARKYLTNQEVRGVAVDVLAFQGISEIDSVDVFGELTTRRRQWGLWYELAALQDPRTIPFAEERFHSIVASADTMNTDTRDSLMEIVDCLYHFRSKESRSLLKRLADSTMDAQVKAYIIRTVGL